MNFEECLDGLLHNFIALFYVTLFFRLAFGMDFSLLQNITLET